MRRRMSQNPQNRVTALVEILPLASKEVLLAAHNNFEEVCEPYAVKGMSHECCDTDRTYLMSSTL